MDETNAAIGNMDIKKLSVHDLLMRHYDAIGELRHRGVLRTGNTPTEDYAEWLASRAFELSLTNSSASDCDGISESGTKI